MTTPAAETMTCDLCRKADTDDIVLCGGGTDFAACCWKCAAKLPAAAAAREEVLRLVLEEGQSLNLAVMFTTGATPRLNTDDTFFQGWKNTGGEQFAGPQQAMLGRYMDDAKAAGVSTQGKRYMHGLAAYPGDPRAWVGTRAEIKEVLRERGLGCERLGVEAATDRPPPPPVRLADDIRDRLVGERLAGVPKRARTKKLVQETREAVVDAHGAPA